MREIITMGKKYIVVGLGQTGLSVVHFLDEQGAQWCAVDTRDNPPGIDALRAQFPHNEIHTGPLELSYFQGVAEIILSPGLSPHQPVLEQLALQGIPIIGDIELFARAHLGRVVGITGSNAKSTVTTLVAKMVEKSGRVMRMGGNIGITALSLLPDTKDIIHVLELSSFQLDTTYSLSLEVACILNITADHLDRYKNMQEYIDSKQRIYQNARHIVVNRDDENTYPAKDHVGAGPCARPISFGLSLPKEKEFGLISRDNTTYLAYGNEILLDVTEFPLQGRHNWSNALVALAIGHCLGLTFPPMLEVLRSFHGLAHRCQVVIKKNNITWYNDSKGTNVGATLAAIAGLQLPQKRHLILIAGGLGKGADFSPLRNIVHESVKLLILYGQDKAIIQQALTGSTDIVDVADLRTAIALAAEKASSGDVVLFSPACASYDMFNNYEHRGELYSQWVLAQVS